MKPSIAAQRLDALQKAVQNKQQFDTLAELRKTKAMTILSHLLEFDCATAQNLLKLLDQKNNAILTRLVKERLIKIMRWQNAQVYIPTARGKEWLLENLDDDAEIERVKNTPIKRKISGYSHEHDLLLQNAAIEFAMHDAAEDENWRLFKPRKTQQAGKVPDAIVQFEKQGKKRQVIIEFERTKKTDIQMVCALSKLVDLLSENEHHVVILTQNQRIYNDYSAAIWAMTSSDDGGLDLRMPHCEMLPGLIPHPALGVEQQGAVSAGLMQNALERIDVQLIDDCGESLMMPVDFEALLFAPVLWQISMRQRDLDWRQVVKRGALALAQQAHIHEPADKKQEQSIEKDALMLAKSLLGAFEGPGGDGNPMRSWGDLSCAWKRWQAATRARAVLPAPVEQYLF